MYTNLNRVPYTNFQARVYLLSSGFSLAFGSMFAKTYRVHRIFTHSGGGVCKDKMLRDTQLISLVCALLLLDGLVVTLWVVADPMERHLSNLTLEISSTDRSVVYQPQVTSDKTVTIPRNIYPTVPYAEHQIQFKARSEAACQTN